ncbi:MAG TPA: GGDEF domain-containing protein [Planctomycetaceae bacterium]|nr:GGDEF domain-containing protein [Planctomycetaceae bacterium]
MPKSEQSRRRTNRQSGPNYCLGFADMDDLKSFNTTYGHSKTDTVIKEVAAALQQGIEREDGSLCARRSGDEFWLLFECTNLAQAQATLQAVCERVKAIRIEGIDKPISCTLAAVFVSPYASADWKTCETRLEQMHRQMKNRRSSLRGTAKVEPIGQRTLCPRPPTTIGHDNPCGKKRSK